MQPISSELPSIFTFLMGALFVVVAAAMIILTLVVYCKITAKAGYHWAWGLFMMVPVANLVVLLYFAFAEWPIQRELRQWRQQYGGQRA
jgi:hypothetical protein